MYNNFNYIIYIMDLDFITDKKFQEIFSEIFQQEWKKATENAYNRTLNEYKKLYASLEIQNQNEINEENQKEKEKEIQNQNEINEENQIEKEKEKEIQNKKTTSSYEVSVDNFFDKNISDKPKSKPSKIKKSKDFITAYDYKKFINDNTTYRDLDTHKESLDAKLNKPDGLIINILPFSNGFQHSADNIKDKLSQLPYKCPKDFDNKFTNKYQINNFQSETMKILCDKNGNPFQFVLKNCLMEDYKSMNKFNIPYFIIGYHNIKNKNNEEIRTDENENFYLLKDLMEFLEKYDNDKHDDDFRLTNSICWSHKVHKPRPNYRYITMYPSLLFDDSLKTFKELEDHEINGERILIDFDVKFSVILINHTTKNNHDGYYIPLLYVNEFSNIKYSHPHSNDEDNEYNKDNSYNYDEEYPQL